MSTQNTIPQASKISEVSHITTRLNNANLVQGNITIEEMNKLFDGTAEGE